MDEQAHCGSCLAALQATCEGLTGWLVNDAYPLWWARGVDRARGGFYERLDRSGHGLAEPRRSRLHPRQIYAFSFADDFGCRDTAVPAAEHGLDFYLRHYRREDGLYRALVAADGAVLDDNVVLYDQAFALLGLAAAFRVLGEPSLRGRAEDLLTALQARLAHPAGGFEEGAGRVAHLTSNSHMHLLEAALLWSALDKDERWLLLARQLVQLALRHFRGWPDGQLREFFSREWQPAQGIDGAVVEPGHQFEWAWLLLQWDERVGDETAATTAFELIELAEARGVAAEREVAMNSLLAGGTIRDGRARLWPQTERLKAACLAGGRSKAVHFWRAAAEAARVLLKYLDTPVRGLWYDTMDTHGRFIEEPAPASSFYHLVGAIRELARCCRQLKLSQVGRGP
jgi:mannose/cellobiose epimerase-like protein (N-acyl-D-glucosamine 2-epimerase family)